MMPPKGRRPKYRLGNSTYPVRRRRIDGVLAGLGNTAAWKFDAEKAHRVVAVPPEEQGIVSIMGPGWLFYANTFGAPGVVSAGQNWDRTSSAAHRGAVS